MKLYKRRGQDRWSGYRNEGRRGISGSAELMPDGRYQVRYSLSNGYGEGLKGTFISTKLKDAENMLDSILDNSLNVIQYKQIAPEDDIKDCYDRDGDIFCPNCMGYYWIGVGNNIRECTTCGAASTPTMRRLSDQLITVSSTNTAMRPRTAVRGSSRNATGPLPRAGSDILRRTSIPGTTTSS
jgi:hypothetical protein